jgi:hypothetical protein
MLFSKKEPVVQELESSKDVPENLIIVAVTTTLSEKKVLHCT